MRSDPNPDRAERIADAGYKTAALVRVAKALAATDPGRAVRLLSDAERAVKTIADDGEMIMTLTMVAAPLLGIDPSSGTRILADCNRAAHWMTDKGVKVKAPVA